MAKKDSLDVAVKFQGFGGSGGTKAHLSFSVPRDQCTLTEIAHFFVGSQVNVKLKIDANAKKDVRGQQTFKGMDGTSVEAIAEINSVSIKVKTITSKLNFEGGTMTATKLEKLSGSEGRMLLERLGDAGDGEEEDGDQEKGGTEDPGEPPKE